MHWPDIYLVFKYKSIPAAEMLVRSLIPGQRKTINRLISNLLLTSVVTFHRSRWSRVPFCCSRAEIINLCSLGTSVSFPRTPLIPGMSSTVFSFSLSVLQGSAYIYRHVWWVMRESWHVGWSAPSCRLVFAAPSSAALVSGQIAVIWRPGPFCEL